MHMAQWLTECFNKCENEMLWLSQSTSQSTIVHVIKLAVKGINRKNLLVPPEPMLASLLCVKLSSSA